MNFNFEEAQRQEILQAVLFELENAYNKPREELIVSKELDVENIHKMVRAFDFKKANNPKEVMLHVVDGLKKHAVHTTHPGYYGLFNPRPNFPSVMADIVKLAGWGHAPYAVEIERLVIREFGKLYGYKTAASDGTFCTGGAESNLTAVLCALQRHIPNISENGLIGLKKQPIIYSSSESHHSLEKAAKIVGLGRHAVKTVAVNNDLSMDIAALKKQISVDVKNGYQPFMVVGTAGTTGAGAIDNLIEIAKICTAKNLWFHVDAAYGGAAILTDLKPQFEGIELSDSITLDLHKWFSVPMATSLFLTHDNTILHKTFNVRTAYMPADGDQVERIDPYIHSIQWSRRFIGLKIYLPLAVFGWKGYSETITHQVDMGIKLRLLLVKNGWIIKNQTDLPIVCFTHPNLQKKKEMVQQLVDELIHSGETWVSTYPIHGEQTIRACITNFDTQEKDLQKLIDVLARTMENFSLGSDEVT